MVQDSLIEAIKNGDRRAFRDLFYMYQRKAFRTAYLILRNRQNAEDVVQETFLQVYSKIDRLSDSNSFEAWLYRITLNCCYNYIKKAKKINTVDIDEEFDEVKLLPNVDFDPSCSEILKKDMQKTIMKCIYELPWKQRVVLILYYYNDFDLKEISEVIKASQGTVKSRLFYAKAALKKSLLKEKIDVLEDRGEELVYEAR